MSKERYIVECLAGGQPRPYADARYVYRVTVEWQEKGYLDKDAPFVPRPRLAPEFVRPILKALTRGWVDEPKCFADRRLERCEMVAPGVWEVVIVEPFTD